MPGPIQTNGLSSAAAALQMLERRQQVLANNLANASTRGFKAETAFARLMDNALATTDTAVNLTPGALAQTHNALDLAIEGDGFFVTQTPAGERFTRNGSFTLDANRQLVDDRGDPVLGEKGPIILPPGGVEVEATGAVKVNGRAVDQLRIERVPPGTDLQHEGGTRFIPDDSRSVVPAGDRRIRQGYLEESNVNPMAAMTEMLSVLHRYGAAQRTLSTLDSTRGVAVTELARPV